MDRNSVIHTVLSQLEKDLERIETTIYRIVYFNLVESTLKDGCYDVEVILSTERGIYRLSYCFCEKDNSYIMCDSQEVKISW